MPTMQEQLLTVEEVAQILRKDPYTIRKFLREGKIPGYKVEGEWLVKRSELEAYIETRKHQSK